MTPPGEYSLRGELGRGGMGVVYAAHHPRRGDVALKLVPPHLVDSGAIERLRREAEALSRLDHPNLARVVEVGVEGGAPFVAMRRVHGESLHDRLRAGPLAPDEVARVGAALAAGLAHAHARGVLHRDLKPSNVLLERPTDQPVLVDFGLAWVTKAVRLTFTGEALGTPAYMAPEQALGDPSAPIGPACDVYGLGATLYHALTGAPPFVAPSNLAILDKVLREPPAPPSRARPGLDPAFERLVLECLEKSPAARPSLDEVARRLQRYAGRPGARRRGRRGRPWARAVGLAAAGVVTGVVGLLARSRGPDATEVPPATASVVSQGPARAAHGPDAAALAVRATGPVIVALERQMVASASSAPQTGRHLALAATRLAPEHADAWFVLAQLLFVQDEHAAAIEALARGDAAAIPHQLADLRTVATVRGLALSRLGRHAEARPHLELACEDPEADVGVLCELGLTLRELGDNAAAVAPFERALRGGLDRWSLRFNLAAALNYSGRHEEALRGYRAARAAPDYFHYVVQLREAELLLLLGRPGEARALLEPCLGPPALRDECERDPQFTATLARALARTGAADEAARWASRSRETGPGQLRGELARLEVLVALGRLDEARAGCTPIVRETLQVSPDPELRRIRELLGP